MEERFGTTSMAMLLTLVLLGGILSLPAMIATCAAGYGVVVLAASEARLRMAECDAPDAGGR